MSTHNEGTYYMDIERKAIYWFRWYDRYPNIRAVVRMTENLSDANKTEIGERLLKVVETFWWRNIPRWRGSKIPAETLDKLRKAKQRNRWYDLVPDLRQAMNMIMVLPEEERFRLDRELASLVGYMANYKVATDAVRGIKLGRYTAARQQASS